MDDHGTDDLSSIERKAATDPCFTEQEKTVLREMIRVYRGWQFVGKVAKGAIVVVGLIAAALASYKTVISEVKRWLIG